MDKKPSIRLDAVRHHPSKLFTPITRRMDSKLRPIVGISPLPNYR